MRDLSVRLRRQFSLPERVLNVMEDTMLSGVFCHQKRDRRLLKWSFKAKVKRSLLYQISGNDCRLFAVASACSICNGQDPSTLKYDQNMMRLHLVNAFFKKKLQPFPAKLVRTGQTTVQCSEEDSVYCVCRQPDGGSKKVQCCKCTE